jgi:hypothetical protein
MAVTGLVVAVVGLASYPGSLWILLAGLAALSGRPGGWHQRDMAAG